MKAIILLLLSMMISSSFYIWNASNNSASDWHVLTDRVMGGISTADMTMKKDYATFSGSISPTDYKGFALMLFNCEIEDVETYSKIVLNIRGDGKKYQLRLRDNYIDKHHYVHNFETTGEQQILELELSEFHPEYEGVRLKESFFDSDDIKQIAIYLGSNSSCNFNLDIFSIELQ